MKSKKKGKLVILSGPSGCGKTTISDHIIKIPGFHRSISATTRPPRPNEKHGIDYIFISEDEFQDKIRQGYFIEYAKYHDYLYGTPIEPLEDAISKGLVVILVIEIKGALQIMKKFPDCISIFIMPPDMETLAKRLEARDHNTENEINHRLEIAREEIIQKDHYDHCVINSNLNQAISTIKNLIINSA